MLQTEELGLGDSDAEGGGSSPFTPQQAASVSKLFARLSTTGDARLGFPVFKALSSFLGQKHLPVLKLWQLYEPSGEGAMNGSIGVADFHRGIGLVSNGHEDFMHILFDVYSTGIGGADGKTDLLKKGRQLLSYQPQPRSADDEGDAGGGAGDNGGEGASSSSSSSSSTVATAMPRENIEAVYQAVWQGNYPLSCATNQTHGLLPPDCPPTIDFDTFASLVRQVPVLAEVFISPAKESLQEKLDGGITDLQLDAAAYALRIAALTKGK
jgi:hypothetical protein